MSVHFKLHYDRKRTNVTTEGLRTLFYRLFNKSDTTRSYRFNQLTIDPHSLYVGGTDTMEGEIGVLKFFYTLPRVLH